MASVQHTRITGEHHDTNWMIKNDPECDATWLQVVAGMNDNKS